MAFTYAFQQLIGKSSQLAPIINEVVITVIILFVGMIAGKIAGNLAYRILKEMSFEKVAKRLRMSPNVARPVAWVLTYGIYTATIIIVLARFRLLEGIGILILVVTVAAFVASLLQGIIDFFPNLIGRLSGHKVQPGQRVHLGSISGIVTHVGILSTTVSEREGELYVLSNSLLRKIR
ncbi:MAG: mechanosensitive ion channel family protein [Nanoarchaeota archaeon]